MGTKATQTKSRTQKPLINIARLRPSADAYLSPDITVVVRMDSGNRVPLDYYLFPQIDAFSEKLRLAEDNATGLDAYRFDNLDILYEIARPVRLDEAC